MAEAGAGQGNADRWVRRSNRGSVVQFLEESTPGNSNRETHSTKKKSGSFDEL
jgi:hypothetical protein